MKKVAQKAKMDCPVDDFNNLLENAKKTKNKWIAIGAGVGLALGAVAAKVISSANANKE